MLIRIWWMHCEKVGDIRIAGSMNIVKTASLPLLIVLVVVMYFTSAEQSGAQETRSVAGTFEFGIVGKQGKNAGTLDNLYNFSSLGLRISFFAFDVAGYDGTQGNDLAGFLRLISTDGQLIDISGAINWQIKDKGQTVYIGIVPHDTTTNQTFNTPIGPYTIDINSGFAVRLPGKTLTYQDGASAKGAANPPSLTVVPTFDVVSVPGPPALEASSYHAIDEGLTAIYGFSTNEWVTWVFSGGSDKHLFDIDPITGTLVFKAPPDYDAPADGNSDNIYEIEMTVWDLDGESTTQTITVEVLEIVLPAQISTTKAVIPAANQGQQHNCASDEAMLDTKAMIPGSCLTYRISVSNSSSAGPAKELILTDSMPDEITAVGIYAYSGFDDVSLIGQQFTGTIATLGPGVTVWAEIRGLLK